jgi:hypothetical protein
MLQVGAAAITAASNSPEPLTPDGASALLAVVAAGVANGASTSAAATTGRRLQSDATAFKPAYDQAATLVSGLLLRSTTPATGYTSAGDSGLYVAVANTLGRSYQGLSPAVVAGPTLAAADSSQADAAAAANVRISFSGALVGNCSSGADDAALTNDAACLVPVVAVYSRDAGAALDGVGISTSLPAGFSRVSGAATVMVAGAAAGALPCAAAGACTASITLPVSQPARTNQAFKCVRILSGKMVVVDDAAVVSSAQPSSTAAASVTCAVKEAGTYLVGIHAAPEPAGQTGLTGTGNVALATYENVTGLVSEASFPQGA